MRKSYFKLRRFLDFSPHPYDVGNPLGFWQKYDDSHFLLKIYKMDGLRYAEYYNYHLEYALENKVGTNEDFFRHVWQIVQSRIRYFENKDPFSSYHDDHVVNITKLQQFQRYLNTIDQWNARPFHIIIAEQEEVIQKQKMEIEKLQVRLDALKIYEVSQKIWIKEGYLTTVIDLFQQMEKLEISDGSSLLKYDHKVAYPRMIGKYFAHGGNDIPVETLRNYYVSKKDDEPVKGTSIQLECKLFKIVPIKGTKK